MTVLADRKPGYAESGASLPTLENYEVCVGENAMPTERRYDMSGNAHSQQNLPSTSQPMKSGEEPTELLLRLVWSPTETLIKRGAARIFVGNGSVAIILSETDYNAAVGLVPTVKASVGSQEQV